MSLHIIVCIKSVIVNASKTQMVRSSDSCEVNPFDRVGLEVALRMKEEFGGTVTALSMGPEPCGFALHEAIAMGVDRGVLACDPTLAGSDTLATSTVLSAAIGKLAPFDIVLFGTKTADSGTGQVGPQAAVLLGLPMVTSVRSITRKKEGLHVERRADGFQERFLVTLPAALTIHPKAVQPRDVALLEIESAFHAGRVERWSADDLGLSLDKVGSAGSPTRVVALSRADTARKCEFLSGGAEEQARELINRLSESGMMW
jgi:electron transfer flavoprotein beta subunit